MQIEVRDTGIGIAENDIPKALQAFGQIESSITRKFGGTGLGLHLVRSMAELQGGAFELTSTLGIGTTARLLFPSEYLQPSLVFAEPQLRGCGR